MSPAAAGRQVGNYRFDEKIGEGGVGEVYRATDLLLDRAVAIKALRTDLAARSEVVERFRAEAQTLAQLNHPNIAILYSLLLEEEELFMVMEFVSGRTFAELLKQEGPMRPDRALPLFFEALDAIGYAHERGFVHRDVKAANVMLDHRGQVKVMDFGIARALGSSRATEHGHLVGTLPYMSPEQIRGDETDARADIYSLGVLLFHLLTGRVPFARRSDYEVMRAHVELDPPPLRHFVPALSPELEAVVMRALSKDPEARFPTTAALREALELDAAIEVLREPTREHAVTAPEHFERTLVLSDDDGEAPCEDTHTETTRERDTAPRPAVSGDAPTRRIERPDADVPRSMRSRAWRVAAGLALAGLLVAGANLLWIGPPAAPPQALDPAPSLLQETAAAAPRATPPARAANGAESRSSPAKGRSEDAGPALPKKPAERVAPSAAVRKAPAPPPEPAAAGRSEPKAATRALETAGEAETSDPARSAGAVKGAGWVIKRR